MNKTMTEKYFVKNIDCANCAAKIENGLRKLAGVDFVSLNFATQTLHVKTSNLIQIIEHVKKIEPTVHLVPQHHQASSEEQIHQPTGYGLKKEITVLAAAFVLFSVELFFENWIHQQPFTYLELIIVLTAYLLAGWKVIFVALRTIRSGTFFDENVLMVIATGGAIAIHAYSEAIGVMIFFKVGELLQELALSRSRRSIRGLLATKPNKAFLQTTEGFREVTPESVNVGDFILVKPGEKIPLDGEVVEGASQIDTSVLTGESIPVLAKSGDTVMAGEICKTGALTVKVTRPFNESSIAKVMDLVENAVARKAKTEKFITTFARYYTPAVVLIAACIAFIPPVVIGASFQTWIYRALVILVISCPCALVISIPLGYFGGIGRASRRGILVKGSNFIDALAAVKTVVFDKTGTLTKGVFHVKEVVNLNGFSKEQVLEFAAAAEYQSNHPIATSILKTFEQQGGNIDGSKVSDHTDYLGKGVTVYYDSHKILVGNDHFLHLRSIDHHKCKFDTTVAHVAVDGKYAGYITIGDELKPGAAEAIRLIKALGIGHVAMLTGDNACAAEAVAKKLDLDSFYADLLPENKVEIFEKLSENSKNKGRTAFVGDGVNDAPVIARADVGVAMGAFGSDAAIETADVVLMTDSPEKMAEAIAISKLTRRIVWQNIILAFAVKGIFLVFGAIGHATMWEAVFADMGTALLAVANSTRILGKKKESEMGVS
ncbi:MAG: cadmium-translocating P-type ATPase [Deltaproteobacteria bacterium]|nr:cadmium-translocating P-type ATPase [Deltaproteobacteria bacterium]